MKNVRVQEADRPGEKVLDLPARSRFGEGRAQPLIDLARASKKAKEKSVSSEYEDYRQHLKRSQF